MATKADDRVRFSPEGGLRVGLTIKEQVKALYDDGYFDKAEAMILGVSNKTDYDARWAGSKFDCHALVSYAGAILARD